MATSLARYPNSFLPGYFTQGVALKPVLSLCDVSSLEYILRFIQFLPFCIFEFGAHPEITIAIRIE